MTRPTWRSIGLLVLSALALAALFRLGVSLEMDRTYFSFRYVGGRQVAAALESMVPGQPGDYTTSDAVIGVVSKYWTIDHDIGLPEIIEEARAKLAAEPGPRLLVWDDKGFVEWLGVALRLFGLHKQSFYYTYFLILGIPMVVHAVYCFRRPAHLFVLLATVLAIYATAPILTLDDQLYSVHDQRFFSVVGLIPLQTVLFVMSGAELTLGAAIAVALQTMALVFVYHCRNDSLWAFMLVAAAAPLFFWRLRDRFPDRRVLALRLVWPVVVLALGMASLNWYKHETYNPQYFRAGRDSHQFSHNLLMGLSFSPRLARDYDLAVDDGKIIRFVGRRMVASGQLSKVDDAFAVWIDEGGRYDSEARTAMIELVKTHPVDSALSIVYKIGTMVRELRYATGAAPANPMAVQSGHQFTTDTARQARNLYYRPFQLAVVLAALVGALLAAAGTSEDWRTVRLVAVLVWWGSLLPPLSSIPMLYILGPLFVTTSFVIYVVVVATGSLWFRESRWLASWRREGGRANVHA